MGKRLVIALTMTLGLLVSVPLFAHRQRFVRNR